MKTHVNFYRSRHHGWLSLFMTGILMMVLGSCTPEKDDLTFRPLPGATHVAEKYIGHYEYTHDDSQPDKIISIDHFTVVNPDDFISGQPGAYQVYISDLVAGSKTLVVATWSGDAFIIDSQAINVKQTSMTLSGRLWLSDEELSVFYTLKTDGQETTYSERFRKMDF